ncbi:MAG: MFS transporter [Candidatus Nanopelagicales bacterium]|nr:MFS transporter [Candidatus Nanopelagicales bacterium]MDZ4249724.1 MFS transporter [Candidatus Nanopelagicales bacterium]
MASAPTEFAGRWGLSRAAIAGLVAAEFFITLDGSAITVALPTIRDAFDSDMGVMQWTLVVYLIAGGALAMPFGAMGDRLGRNRVLVAGLLLFLVGSLTTAAAPTMTVLVLGRALAGAGASAIGVLALAILAGGVKQERIPTVVGTWTALTTAASVLSPAVSGLIVQTMGWRWMFTLSAIPALAVAYVVGRLPEDGSTAEPSRVDWLGSGILTVATLLIAGGLNGAVSADSFHPAIAFALGIGVALIAALVFQQRRADSGIMDWRPLGRHPIPVLLASRGIVVLVVTGVMFQQTMLLQNGLGYSPAEAGAMDIPPALTMLLMASLAAPIARRIGPALTIAVGFWLLAAGMYGMSRADYDASLAGLIVSFSVFGIGFGLSSATLSSAVLASVPSRGMGGLSGALSLLGQLAAALGIAIVGLAVAKWILGAWAARGDLTCPGTDLIDNVVGGAISEIASECGTQMAALAREAYTDGITDALYAGGVVLVLVGILVLLTLRGRVASVVEDR